MESRVLTAANQGVLIQALLGAGILTMTETTPTPVNGVVVSWINTKADEDAAVLVALDESKLNTQTVWNALQTAGATLDSQLEARRLLWGANEANVVPTQVTMRQARLALLGAGKLAGVEAAINALPEPTKSAAKITWDYSSVVQRNNGLVPQLASALGMTSKQIDDLFIAASKIV
jgi:hypothetical protein